MIKIIDRYIAKEIFFPFGMSLFVLTFVLLMGKILQLMDLMINKGVSIIDVSKLILYLLPSFLLITIPISLLISILIGLGRLSADNEITVLKSSGVSLYRLFVPIAGAALLAFIISVTMGMYFVPYGNYATRNLLFDIAKKKATIGIKEKIFNDDFKGLVLYANKIPVHGDFMEGVFIADKRIIKEPTTIIAEKGYLISNPESMTVTLRLKNGSTHTVASNQRSYKKIDFSSYDITLDLSTPITQGRDGITDKKSKEMNLTELIATLKKHGLEARKFREIVLELNKKLAIPFSCIVFGILGLPLGIGQHRSGKSRGFTVGLVVITTYYVLQLSGEALGETGRLSPTLGAWVPNIVLGVLGIYLLIRVVKERPPRLDFIVPSFIRRKVFTPQNRKTRSNEKKMPHHHNCTTKEK